MKQLNDSELDKLQVFLADEVLLATVHKIFTGVIEQNRPVVSDETNEIVGQKYRAYELSKQILAEAFTELENQKKTEQGNTMAYNRAV